MNKLPPLIELRAFDAAARHLSFKKAAAELGVTPTAISHQIRHAGALLRAGSISSEAAAAVADGGRSHASSRSSATGSKRSPLLLPPSSAMATRSRFA